MKRSVLAVILICAAIFCHAQTPVVQFKGLVQGWFSYGQDNGGDDELYGFSLHRARLSPGGKLTKNISWGMTLSWDRQKPAILDAYLEFAVSRELSITAGQFSAPGAISSSLTSSGKLDMIERPIITSMWGSNNSLTSFRAIGLQLSGYLLEDKLYYAFMAANPRTASIFNPSNKDPLYANPNNGLMFWARLEAKPTNGLSIGAFIGSGKETDTDLKRESYGAHFFYVKNNFNLKAEYIAGKAEVNKNSAKYNGMYALLGYTVNKVEPVIRYDTYVPLDGSWDNLAVRRYNCLTFGLNYFHNENVKLQANYVVRSESMQGNKKELDNNLFYVQLQYTFKSN